MTLTSQSAVVPARGVDAQDLPATTVAVVFGPESRAAAVEEATALAGMGVEVLLIDDGAPEDVLACLAAVAGGARVRHDPLALGSAGALAGAAETGRGVLVLATDPRSLAAPQVDELRAAFLDPGVGLCWLSALGTDEPAALALRRTALATLKGRDGLARLLPPHLPPDRIVPTLAARLSPGRWRTRAIEGSGPPLGVWQGAPHAPAPSAPLLWRAPAQPRRPSPGVNLIGMLEASCGIGDAGRRYQEALEVAGVPHATFSWNEHASPPAPFVHRGGDALSYDTNLIVLNPDVLMRFAPYGGAELFARRRTIGLWFWEIEELHPRLLPAFGLIDELWVATDFLERAFGPATTKPVTRVPLPIGRRDGTPRLPRAACGLPDAFTFLVVFDFRSLALRKNAIGAIRAFCAAFKPGEGPFLVVKSSGAEHDPASATQLVQAAAGRRDVIFLEDHVDDEVVDAMIGHAECFVSLHRAEGFGLGLAQAMAWGRPVIATAYSGNLDFMTDENSYLVPFSPVPVPASLGAVYPAGARWAEPDLIAAANAMRAVITFPEQAAARARRGQADIRRTHSSDAVARVLGARLEALATQNGKHP